MELVSGILVHYAWEKKHGRKWFGSRTLFTLEAEEEVLPPEGKAELLWLVLPGGWVRWFEYFSQKYSSSRCISLDFEGLGGGGSSGSSESESLKTQSCNFLKLLNEALWGTLNLSWNRWKGGDQESPHCNPDIHNDIQLQGIVQHN